MDRDPTTYRTERLGSDTAVASAQKASLIRSEAERLDQLATQCELIVEQLRDKLRPIIIDAPQVTDQSYKDPNPTGSDLGNALHRVSSRLDGAFQEFRDMMAQLDI